MSKLTKQQKTGLISALQRLKAAQEFIMSSKTHIVREYSLAAETSHAWTNGEGKPGVEITKEIGSDLVGLRQAIHILEMMLKEVE